MCDVTPSISLWKELRHAYEWVMSHTCVWRSYVTHTNESCHTHNTCNLIHYRGHVSGMTHVSLSSVWHDACVTVMCVTWPMCHTLTCVWATWFNIAVMCVINSDVMCVTWLIRMCDVTDSYTCVTWRIHAHVRQDSFMHVCDMTHSCTCATWLLIPHRYHKCTWMSITHVHGWVMSHIWISHVTQMISKLNQFIIATLNPESCQTNELCHTCTGMSHVTHVYEQVMPHMCMSQSCHTHTWMSNVTRMNQLMIWGAYGQ